MKALLERWSRLEPERCHEVEYGDGTALAVVVEGETLYADSPGRVKADQAMSRAHILAATIEAITARSWMWSLGTVTSRPSIWGFVNPDGTRSHEGAAATPAEALLAAYLSALEAA